jgi:hypothetical protein
MARVSVNFGEAEIVVARGAAAAAGLKFNAWVRRACREQAALEAALARQEAESRVGIERPGWDAPSLPSFAAAEKRSFQPDFK